jgi:hypothetical protein
MRYTEGKEELVGIKKSMYKYLTHRRDRKGHCSWSMP